MKRLLFGLLALISSHLLAVGSVTVTQTALISYLTKVGDKVTVSWTADAAAATVPDTSMYLNGFLVRAVVNPGATAPTDLYDVTITGDEDTSFDVLGSALLNLSTSATQQFYPVFSGATTPMYLNGTYTMKWANNAVNSALGVITMYFLNHLY